MAALTRAPSALAAFFSNTMKLRGLNQKYVSHLLKKDADNATAQKFHWFFQTYGVDEAKQLVVYEDLPMTRKEFTEMLVYKEDLTRMSQPLLFTFACGGLSLVGLPLWANAPHRHPSTFFKTEEEAREAGKQRDLEYHIKHAPQTGHSQTRQLEFFLQGEAKHNEAFDSIANGFTAAKDPVKIRKLGQHIAKQGSCNLQYLTSDLSSWDRDRDHYDLASFLGHPFFMHTHESMNARVLNHYRALFQEDVLLRKEGLASVSDFELYEICNRRLIARWEEDLTRAQLEARLQDWWTVTEIKEGEEKVPLRVVVAYQTSFFRDPGFLDRTLESLDEDAFPSAWNWARTTFERRVELETGPLAEHVRAHIEKTEKREAEMLEQRKAYLEGSA